MDKQPEGIQRSCYEISDLHMVFNMCYLDDMTVAKDYGTGNKYTMLEAHTITLIERNPGVTVTEISEIFKRSKSAISQLITRLEKKGLVVKTYKIGESKKVKGLYVTPEGRRLSICHVNYDEMQVGMIMKNLFSEGFTASDINGAHKYMEFYIKNNELEDASQLTGN